jgi:molybdenum cofactor biosynthesis enzyme MoaA
VEELTRADGKELRFCPNCTRSILDADGTCQRCRWRRIAKDLALALRKAEKLSSPTTIGEEDCMTRADETRGESAPLSSGSTASTHPLKMAQEATYQEGSVK